MIPAEAAAALFEQIIGWPYASPGSNDQSGIDCSGAWVRVYRQCGGRVAHGSNSQYRQHCARRGEINGEQDLAVGMAVFKRRFDGGEPEAFRGDGLGNLYHVGCVTRVHPLRIVHATPPNAKADTSIKGWTHWGEMDQVEYRGQTPQPVIGTAVVGTQEGALNVRETPDIHAARVGKAPRGAVVDVIEDGDGWARIAYGGVTGWASKDFLRVTWADGSDAGGDGEPGVRGAGGDGAPGVWGEGPGVWIPCGTADEARAIVAVFDLLAGMSSGALVRGG